MSVGLLDVNALIALLWEEHPFHGRCAEWFARSAKNGWATCPITESGCVRVLCTPAFTANPPSVQAAIRMIKTATESGRNHRFWMDDLPLSAVGTRWHDRLGPKQITDAVPAGSCHSTPWETGHLRPAHSPTCPGGQRGAGCARDSEIAVWRPSAQFFTPRSRTFPRA